jgi:hypothetical protein
MTTTSFEAEEELSVSSMMKIGFESLKLNQYGTLATVRSYMASLLELYLGFPFLISNLFADHIASDHQYYFIVQ